MSRRARICGLLLVITVSVRSWGQDRGLLFRANGAGLWVENGQKSELIVVVELRSGPRDLTTLTVRPIDGIPQRFSGKILRDGGKSYTLAVTGSNRQLAKGVVNLENDNNGKITFLLGRVLTEQRTVLFHFTRQRPLRWNSLTIGSGTLSSGQDVTSILAASVISTAEGIADLRFLLEDGNLRRLQAAVSTRHQDGALLQLLSDNDLQATGTISLERDDTTHTFDKIVVEGVADGVPILVRFSSRNSSN